MIPRAEDNMYNNSDHDPHQLCIDVRNLIRILLHLKSFPERQQNMKVKSVQWPTAAHYHCYQ